ncbi:MAG TPA: NAD-dependent epimerase/dehydratase family protein [Gemmatimonadales bacterium]|nr:NAD-dependent epimerase/dehydratase family protein [Gemmatimonadales bacterium]
MIPPPPPPPPSTVEALAPAPSYSGSLLRVRRLLLDWSRGFEIHYLRHPVTRWMVKVLLDLACGAGAVLVALAVDGNPTQLQPGDIAALAIAVGSLLVLAHIARGSHRTIWRYTSLREASAVAVSAALVGVALMIGRRLGWVPVSGAVVLSVSLLTLFNALGMRALRRWQVNRPWRRRHAREAPTYLRAPRRILIVGAGRRGLSIGRELVERGTAAVELAGYLDDDPAKRDAILNGARVLGRVDDALDVCDRYRIAEVIVAMPSADPAFVRGFVRRLEAVGVRTRAVQDVERFVNGRELHRPGAATLHELIGKTPGRDRGISATATDHGRRRVLITGGAGYIGSHLVRMLLDRGYHVRILDRFDYGQVGIQGLSHPNFEIIQGDVCSTRDVSRAVRNVDGVIALAAIVGDPACNLDPEETVNLNYASTKILAETCNFYGVRRLVFASSCSVYGASSKGLLTERSRLNPVSLYARTRVLSENILFDRHGDVEPVVVRLATVFGLSPRMRFDLVVNTMTARAATEGRISVFGGNQWRPNVHCRDAARAFVMALEAPASDVAGEIFNLGGDENNHRIGDIGDMVAQIVGGVEVERRDEVADPRDYRVSFAKIRRVLGFEPEHTVADGIREVCAAVRADPALRRWQEARFHNVQALQQTFVAPRRRREDFAPVRNLAQA